MGTNAYATVALLDGSGTAYEARVNNDLEYVIPAVPIDRDFTLLARIDGGVLKQLIRRETGLEDQQGYRIDLAFANSAPRLTTIASLDGTGKAVEHARPGDTVVLSARAEDRDGDPLSFRWLVTDGNGSLDALDQPEVKWKVPGIQGRYSVMLAVTDGKGGYAERAFPMRVTIGGTRFSGRVVDVSGAAVASPTIEVNGRSVQGSNAGVFRLEVPVAERYVMNIRKSGYGTASHVYPGEVTGDTWTLRSARVTRVNPSAGIDLTERREKNDCPGPRTRRIDWAGAGYLREGLIQWQDGAGSTLSLPELGVTDPAAVGEVLELLASVHPDVSLLGSALSRIQFRPSFDEPPCGGGIAVSIPPGALVDRDGNLPAGQVDVSLSTVDLSSPGQMPGDYSARDRGGDGKVMESYGAGSVEITDGSKRYNLKQGTIATVTIPVDRAQLLSGVALPPTMPLLYYDEVQGVWLDKGELQLTGSGSSSAYRAQVSHFSALNVDLLKDGQSCVSVISGPGLPASYDIEVTVPPRTPGAAPTVLTFAIDNSSGNEHVIYNLPNGVNIALVPIVSGTRPDGSIGDVPAGVFVVNTGGPQTSVTDLPPGPPYYTEDASGQPLGPCLTQVFLEALAVPEAPDSPNEFLQGLDLQATNLTELDLSNPGIADAVRDASEAYYALADQRGLREDLAEFKLRNKFGQPVNAAAGELEVSTAYANSGDLGFGRRMTCRVNVADDGKFDVVAFVTNYGDHLTPDAADAVDAANQNADAEVATVAMEYSRVENPPGDPNEFLSGTRTVKFFVYKKNKDSVNPGQKNGRDISADLDGNGERPVPQLCIVCHGGAYAAVPVDPSDPFGAKKPAFELPNDVFMNSRFLPFDLHFFTSPPAPNDITAQQPQFKSMNLDVVRKVPEGALATDPVIEVLDELYAGGAAVQKLTTVVSNWDKANPASADHAYYRDVFARACRGCHITSPFNNLVMNTKTEFRDFIAAVQDRVCDDHVMPHARRTHDLFWTSVGPSMPAQTAVFGQTIPGWNPNLPDAQCGLSFTSGGNPPASAFTTEIEPIFADCAGCHSTTTAATANLNLSFGSAYASLFSGSTPIASHEHPATKRVQPGNSIASYLYRKVEGTHTSLPGPFVAPGPGARMPQNCSTCLDQIDTDGDGVNDMEEIRVWIDVFGGPGP